MTKFNIYDETNAPEKSKPLLAKSKAAYGSVPNLLGELAESPAALEGYMKLSEIFIKSSLAPEEKHLVLLTASVENECKYCVAAHTGLAKAAGLPGHAIMSVREMEEIEDNDHLEALRDFTRKIVVERGDVSEKEVEAFLDAGYSRANVFEVILGVAMKTLSNYANHIAETPVDASFAINKWTPPGKG
jgi:uncharacterized peroxidase-related enzyme